MNQETQQEPKAAEIRPIEKVLIFGRGSVGLTEGLILSKVLKEGNFAFAADPKRIERYRSEPLMVDGKPAAFRYADSADEFGKADLILIASKYGALKEIMELMEPYMDEKTIVMSAINGIVSEEDLRRRFPDHTVIRTIAQKMDSVYDGQNMNHSQTGELVFGADLENQQEVIRRICELFERSGLPYVLSEDILYDQWNKLMLNCGINEVCAAYNATYGQVLDQPELLKIFMDSMEEVRKTAAAEGINLKEDEPEKWAQAVAKLGYGAMPSMAQDVKHNRPTELSLFAGTIIPLARKHGVPVPVLEDLYSKIDAIDARNRKAMENGSL